MRLKRKLKRTTKQYIVVALICIIVIGSAAIFTSIITIGQVKDEYEYMLNEARQELSKNKKTVYIAQSNIKKGEILTIDKVEIKSVYSSQPSNGYITKNEIGGTAIIDIPEGTHIIKGMLAQKQVSSVLREVEYDVIHMSSNIEVNDYVDVRIVFPNGENCIVMSKKLLIDILPDTAICYMWVEEEEILRMSAAIVDAALYKGSKLYMTKYIEPNIQDASIITYTPNISVLSLIENDPNIVERCSQLHNKEVRKAMENRLAESLGIDVSAISWELDEIQIETKEKTDKKVDKNVDEKADNKVDEKADNKVNEKADKKTGGKASSYFPELGVINEYDGENYSLVTEG